MTWTEEITLGVGIATLVVTVAGWLVTFLSGRAAAKERERAEERLQGSQGDIQAKLAKLQSSINVRSHVQIVHSEHEIEIYRLLWERIEETRELANSLPEANDDDRLSVFRDLKVSFIHFQRTVYRNLPFYSPEIYRECQYLLSRTRDIQELEAAEDQLVGTRALRRVQLMFDDVAGSIERIFNAIRKRSAQIAGLPEPEDVSMFPPEPPPEDEERRSIRRERRKTVRWDDSSANSSNA